MEQTIMMMVRHKRRSKKDWVGLCFLLLRYTDKTEGRTDTYLRSVCMASLLVSTSTGQGIASRDRNQKGIVVKNSSSVLAQCWPGWVLDAEMQGVFFACLPLLCCTQSTGIIYNERLACFLVDRPQTGVRCCLLKVLPFGHRLWRQTELLFPCLCVPPILTSYAFIQSGWCAAASICKCLALLSTVEPKTLAPRRIASPCRHHALGNVPVFFLLRPV